MIALQVDSAITIWSKRFGLVLLGWFLSSAYHGTLYASKAIRAVPALEAAAGCEHYRAGKATETARQAIVAANSESIPVPSASALPKDNCPHPAETVQK